MNSRLLKQLGRHAWWSISPRTDHGAPPRGHARRGLLARPANCCADFPRRLDRGPGALSPRSFWACRI